MNFFKQIISSANGLGSCKRVTGLAICIPETIVLCVCTILQIEIVNVYLFEFTFGIGAGLISADTVSNTITAFSSHNENKSNRSNTEVSNG